MWVSVFTCQCKLVSTLNPTYASAHWYLKFNILHVWYYWHVCDTDILHTLILRSGGNNIEILPNPSDQHLWKPTSTFESWPTPFNNNQYIFIIITDYLTFPAHITFTLVHVRPLLRNSWAEPWISIKTLLGYKPSIIGSLCY